MAASLITLQDIHLTFGGTPLLTGAELNIVPGDRICLVGRNGSGKSTLMKIAAGLVEVDSGKLFFHPDASIRYLPQEVDFSAFETSLEAAHAGLGPFGDTYEVQILLEELGLSGEESTATMSGGEARRTALVQALVARPDVLLLDEPTNHLDIIAIDWLEAHLKPLKSAIVIISHDRRFLENMSRSTVWLDRGKTRRLEKGFSQFESWRDHLLETEEKENHKLNRKIAREVQWMHGGVSGRRKRNQRRVAELAQMRRERNNRRHVPGAVKLEVSEGALGGKLVSEAVGISKSFGAQKIVDNFSTKILRGDRIGIIGQNGAGKTTLLNMLTGGLKPDSGRIRLGKNLQMVTLDQKRETLNLDKTLAETLTGSGSDQVIINDKPRHVIGYMKDFLFQPEQARSAVSVLSGGERCRLMLARALAKPSNILVLDEPTNDLDLETLDLLQEMIAEYDGTVLLVSHDRDFIDRVVTSVIVSEGDGLWVEYAGGYSDAVAQRAGRAPVGDDKVEGRNGKKRRETNTGNKPGAQADVFINNENVRSATALKVSRKKLSFKDKHALDTLPGDIENLQREIGMLESKLADPGLFANDAKSFENYSRRLPEAQEALAKMEEQWLELEMKREEIEG